MELIAATGAIDATLRRAADYAERAQGALSLFPDSRIRGLLGEVATDAVNRERRGCQAS